METTTTPLTHQIDSRLARIHRQVYPRGIIAPVPLLEMQHAAP